MKAQQNHVHILCLIMQYSVYSMPIVLFCFVFVIWTVLGEFMWFVLPIFFGIVLTSLGQSHGCPIASEVIMKDGVELRPTVAPFTNMV